MSYDVMSCLWSHVLFLVLFHDVIPWYDVMIGPSHAPGPMLLQSLDQCLRCDQCFTFWPISSQLLFDFKSHM